MITENVKESRDKGVQSHVANILEHFKAIFDTLSNNFLLNFDELNDVVSSYFFSNSC